MTATSTFAERLIEAEYKSVRDEWLASRAAQQQTLQWSLAGISLLLVGILNAWEKYGSSFIYVAVTGAAGVLMVAAQTVWTGEFLRMERAALFLRGREKAFGGRPGTSIDEPPLLWEQWRAARPEDKALPWIPGGGGLLIVASQTIYGVSALVGLSAALLAALDDRTSANVRAAAWVVVVTLALTYVTAAGLTARYARRVLHARNQPADLAAFAKRLRQS